MLRAQSFRWIDAVGAPEELRKPARGAKAIAKGNPGDRLGAAGAQHLGPSLLDPDPPQGSHWRRTAEALECHLQSANAAPRRLRDLGDRQRCAGIGPHEFLGSPDVAGCGCRTLLLQTLRVAVWQAQEQAERQIIFEGARRDLVTQQRAGTPQLDEEEIEHIADSGARAARLIEGWPEREGTDLLSIQQDLQPFAKAPPRHPKVESDAAVARGKPGAGLATEDQAGFWIPDHQLVRPGTGHLARALRH